MNCSTNAREKMTKAEDEILTMNKQILREISDKSNIRGPAAPEGGYLSFGELDAAYLPYITIRVRRKRSRKKVDKNMSKYLRPEVRRHRVSATCGMYLRIRMREDGFARKILPPVKLEEDALEPGVLKHYETKLKASLGVPDET